MGQEKGGHIMGIGADSTGAERRPSDVRLRVLVVYQHIPLYREAVFRELLSSDVVAYSFAAGDPSSRVGRLDTVSQSVLPRLVLSNVWLGPFLWQRGLLRHLLVSHNVIDAVIFLGDWRYLSTWIGAVIVRLQRKRVVFWTHGWRKSEGNIRSRVRLGFYGLADQLLLYGNRGYRLGVEAGYPPSRMSVVYNSLSASPSPRLPESVIKARRDVRIVVSTRLLKARRLDLLILAARELASRDVCVGITFIGEGPDRDFLQALAEKHAIDARFLGSLYDEHSLQLAYSESDMCVLPCAAGLAVIQSLSFGKPVIVSDDFEHHGPESEAVVSGLTGEIFTNGSVTGLAVAIEVLHQALLQDPIDWDARCRAVVQRFFTAQQQRLRIDNALFALVGARHH